MSIPDDFLRDMQARQNSEEQQATTQRMAVSVSEHYAALMNRGLPMELAMRMTRDFYRVVWLKVGA